MFFFCGSSKAGQREVTTTVSIIPYVPIIILCALLAYTDLVVDATTLAVAEKMKVCGNANVQFLTLLCESVLVSTCLGIRIKGDGQTKDMKT